MSNRKKAVYTTATPRLFAKFFMQENFEKISSKLDLYEKCHGYKDSVSVEFYAHSDNGPATLITNDNVGFEKVVNYNFSDYQNNKYDSTRILLVTVEVIS